MGWRFRKRITIAKGLRINVSEHGASIGVGPRGANVNISHHGLRETAGIPGSGMSYQTTRRWGRASNEHRPGIGAFLVGALLIFVLFGFLAALFKIG
ncbi:MAG: hypothetical protein B7Z78_00925 [Rhodospirillales bacterium 20-60-12]|nr:MAG: hypothetical protein B7Z78_00925 [Rhodospirillales bacterium 20-60-12]HQT66189.1 DUF4236 domain-containing protein [Acetobacteraceae bacterium]HQU01925.1 DUF4236 domain-containing protein [Acetobacteraceae bacterium]